MPTHFLGHSQARARGQGSGGERCLGGQVPRRERGCKSAQTPISRADFPHISSTRMLIWRGVCQGGVVVSRVRVGGWGCGRLGGWRSGCCARRVVRLIYAGSGGRRTMVRRGEPLSYERAWPAWAGCSKHHRGFPARAGPPPTQPTGWGCWECWSAAHSIWVIAQQKPASSRATATLMIVRRLVRCSSRVQTRCSRRWADQAIAIASGGCPC
jgi:hypothetical protein